MNPQAPGRDWLLVVAMLMVAARLTYADPPAERFREHVAINTSSGVARALAATRDAAAEERWSEAVDQLISLSDGDARALVEAERGRYVLAGDLAQELLRTWPAAALGRYRDRIDPRARAALQAARDLQDLAALEDAARMFSLAAPAQIALWEVGEQLWRRGRIGAARRNWEQLLSTLAITNSGRSPAEEISPAAVSARLVLCSVVERDFDRAAAEIKFYQEQFPEARGQIAAETGRLADLLERQLDLARARPGSAPETHAVFSRSALSIPHAVDRFQSLSWLIGRRTAPVDANPYQSSARPYCLPVADEQRLFFIEPTGVRALLLGAGSPAWPTGLADDQGQIYRFPPMAGFQSAADEAGILCAGIVSQDRLVAYVARQGPRPRDAFDGRPARLIGLDIGAGQGKLLWSQAADGPLSQAGWAPAGPPLCADGDIWLAVERMGPRAELGLARLRLSDGAVRSVQSVLAPLHDDEDHDSGTACWLASGEGNIYLLSDQGALAAADELTGQIRWIATFPFDPQDSSQDLTAVRSSPPVTWRGLVIAAPAGAGAIVAWDARSGRQLWRTELHERRLQIAGVSQGRLVASGRHLWGIDPATGDVFWRFGFVDPGGAGAAAPGLTPTQAVWCTRHDVFLIETATGALQDRLPLRERYNLDGGPVLLCDGALVVIAPTAIASIEYASRRPPDDPRPAGRDQ